MDINSLKVKRTYLRRIFTQACNEYDNLNKDETQRKDLLTLLRAVEDKANRLFDIDSKVSDLIFSEYEDKSPDEVDELITKEFDTCEQYRDRWIALKIILDDLTSKSPNNVDNINSSNSLVHNTFDQSRKLHLPKIQLKQFDGNIRNWLGFWSQFKKIEEDPLIELEDKFQYLIQSTVPNTSARELVESYPPTKENYPKAIKSLKCRFAREELLVEVYVRDLLNLVLEKNSRPNTCLSLSSLHDKLTTQLNALESLGLTSEKYGAMLFPLVESALPEDTLRAWERHRNTFRVKPRLEDDNADSTKSKLSLILDFIKAEVESEERLNLARSGFTGGNSKVTPPRRDDRGSHGSRLNVPTAATILSTNNETKKRDMCLFCSKPHSTTDCAIIVEWTLDQKRDQLKKHGGCFTCLKQGHSFKKCKSFVKCLFCKGRHHIIMCNKMKTDVHEETSKGDQANQANPPENVQPDHKTNVLLSQWNGQCYLQTLVVNVKADSGVLITVRALLDAGSQRSYISKKCVDQLNPKKVDEEIVTHTLFGGVNIKNLKHDIYDIELSSLHENFKCKARVMDQDKICNFIPQFADREVIESLKRKNIILTDTGYDLDIEILIGADIVSKLLTTEFQTVGNGLVAVKTKLGWTVMGQLEYRNKQRCKPINNFTTTSLNSLDLPKLWKLDVIGIHDPAESKAQHELDMEAMDHFMENVKINEDGRYSVKLPWKEGHPQLLDNKDLSTKRLQSTTKRLLSLGKLEAYTEVFNDWESSGIIERVDELDSGPNLNVTRHYLPHHPVLKESSLTTKVRPVFDASARDKNGNTLNDCLVKGPNLVEIIPTLITRFRKFDFGVTADITKAFLQIDLHEKDREYLQFLWWKTNDCKEICTYRHCRVVFGLKSSPFLLGAVIKHLLDASPHNLQDTANMLKKSFYVDNCITSFPSKAELEKFIDESKALMAIGKFDLRSWVFTEENTSKGTIENLTPLLGLMWDPQYDTLSCNVDITRLPVAHVTKRTLLSIAQSIFDPIGFTSPSTLIPKLLLQKTWNLKVGWDSELPKEIVKPFQQWTSQIHFLNECRIPRKLSDVSVLVGDCSLHVFSDASILAYSACIFLRVQLEEKVSVQLVAAKSRVAPCGKPITIPRLELLGAVIATRLYKQVETSLELNCKTRFWTDSTVVLAWIKRKDDWNMFVANRCKEIQENTNTDDWHHIAGQDNPADLPSRGCSFKSLSQGKWWQGPTWLYKSEDEWNKTPTFETAEEEVIKEKKKSVVTAANIEENNILTKLKLISKYSKIIRTVGWIMRFIQNSRIENTIASKELTGEEIISAEVSLFKMVQRDSMLSQNKNSLKKLQIFEDKKGLLRIRSRLTLSEDNEGFKNPILLPASDLIKKLIRHYHIVNRHAGVQILLNILREEFWILGGRKTIKSAISQCVQCKRQNAKHIEVPFAPLPEDRIKDSKVFEVTGIDLAGPLILKSQNKAWVVLYTCAVYRAVHLELIQSLSTDSFLQSLRRFIARRGRPALIYSDNGTNFLGASKAFSKLNWTEIMKHTSIQKIIWKFNPPSAPWWGGWWERLIGILKNLLRKSLGRSSLYYEELYTVLCDCEAILNSRPLTYVSSDCNDLIPLSPSSFLQSVSSNEVKDIDCLDGASLNKRLRYVQQLREELRGRFRKEYLGMLVNYGKPSKQKVAVGDIVLVEMENLKRIAWPLGKVTKIFPGKDSVTRLVKVKVANGEILRPVQRIFPLEIARANTNGKFNEECQKTILDENSKSKGVILRSQLPVQVTSRGRAIKVPKRLDI